MDGRTIMLRVYRALDGSVYIGIDNKKSVKGATLRKALLAAADAIQPNHDN